MKQNMRFSLDRYIIFFCVIFLVLIWCVFFLVIRADKNLEMQRVRNETANLSVVLGKHIIETFSQIENSLFSMRQIWESGINQEGMHSIFSYITASKSDLFNLISIINSEGNVILTDQQNVKPTFSGDRPFFIYHKTHPDNNILINSPILGRVTGKWYIPVSIRLNDAKGNFSGVLLASVNPYYFSKIFHDVNLGNTSLIYLADSEGITYSGMLSGKELDLNRQIPKDEAAGFFHEKTYSLEVEKSHLDKVKRILSSTPIKDRDMFVVVAVGRDECLKSWRTRAIFLIIIQLVVSCFIFLFLFRFLKALFDRNQAEDELRLSEENLRITLNSIGDAVIATDTIGIITHINPVAGRLTGWKIDEALGMALSEVFHIESEETRERIIDPVRRVIEEGEIVELENHTILVSRDGKEFLISDSGSPIRNDSGDIIGAVLVFRDVSEEYALQQQLFQSQKLEAIGQLAGGVAHDFNNMLGGIMGAAELLKLNLPDEKNNMKNLELILKSAQRAADLASKLLAFARQKSIVSTPIDVHRSISEAVELLKNTIDKRVKIESDLSAEISTVIGDATQLQNIFLNLGINSNQAMADGGILSFKTKNVFLDSKFCVSSAFELFPGDYIEILVSDTGCGIKKDNLSKIFDPFFTTKEKGKGTGLGLAAVYGTVQRHKGSITVTSELGRGTEFCILLPLTFEKEREFKRNDSVLSGMGLVLMADDESVMRTIGEDILKGLGYDVIMADNGKEALDIYIKKQNEIKLVILDMIMPEMNGRDCFNEIKKINPNAKIILCSGFSRSEDIEELKKKGINGFIHKPFRVAELSRVIFEALN